MRLQIISGRCMLIQRTILRPNRNLILCSCPLHKKTPNSANLFDLVNVELIDKCIRLLKLGKACGPDELSAEHLVHAHPLWLSICFFFAPWLCMGSFLISSALV